MESADRSNLSENHGSSSDNVERQAAGGSNSLVPPYWSHRRYESYCSIGNTKPPPITLEDHTEDEFSISSPLWANGVTIDDHVLVTGSVPNIGKFIVWNCKIDTLDGGSIVIRKRLVVAQFCHWSLFTLNIRYSEFDDLRKKLLMTFPNANGAMPPLPPKSLISEHYVPFR